LTRGKLLLVLGVLGAAAAAFAISEGLKVQRAAVTNVKIVNKIFSPVCGCPQRRATIGFSLTRKDKVSVSMLDDGGKVVRTLVTRKELGRGAHHFTWNGRNDRGRVVPEASYRPRVELDKADKTYDLPNPIQVDVTRPIIRALSVKPRVISPDGDGHSDVTRVEYRISERGQALLYVGGRREARSRFKKQHDTINWYGKRNGRAVPPGRYVLSLAAIDRAGNRSARPVKAGLVRVRYVQLSVRRIVVAPGGRIAVTVSTDAPRVQYVLRRGASIAASGRSGRHVVVRAPIDPGRYVLTVGAGGHFALAAVLVGRQ